MKTTTDVAGRAECGTLLLIGRRERVDFPEWGLRRVRAKIDTGAYSSALDVAGYDIVETEGGLEVAMRIVPNRRRSERVRVVRTPALGMTNVRSSTGVEERRPVIEALVRLGPVTKRIRLTVTDRSKMKCRMLLGRHALAGEFLVDVCGKDLLGKSEREGR